MSSLATMFQVGGSLMDSQNNMNTMMGAQDQIAQMNMKMQLNIAKNELLVNGAKGVSQLAH